MKLVLALVVFSMFALPALGQSGRKVTVIDFKNDVIEGDLNTPDIEVHRGTAKWIHAKLVKPRRTFKARVLASIGQL